MTLKGDAEFGEKLTCGLENDMRNMANFQSQNGTFMGSFNAKKKMYQLNIHREVMCHDNEE